MTIISQCTSKSRKLPLHKLLLQAARGQYHNNKEESRLSGSSNNNNYTDNNNTDTDIISSSVDDHSNSSFNNVKKGLPCFPIHHEHIRVIQTKPQTVVDESSSSSTTITSSSSSSSSSSCAPSNFHQYLCTALKNAKHRVKFATLYIGAGNGCMSLVSSSNNIIDENTHNDNHTTSSLLLLHRRSTTSPKEEELLSCLQQLAMKNNNNHQSIVKEEEEEENNIEIKIILDASRGLRPIKIVYEEEDDDNKTQEGTISNSDNNQRQSSIRTTTTTSAHEVYCALFPQGHDVRKETIIKDSDHNNNDKKNRGISLFNAFGNNNRFISSLPSPLNEVFGVFHLKVCRMILVIFSMLIIMLFIVMLSFLHLIDIVLYRFISLMMN